MKRSIDEDSFTAEVLGASCPVLVHFWAPWCGLCRAIDPLLEQFQTRWGPQVKLVGINADRNLKLANAYRLTALPTLILFEGGEPVFRMDCVTGREELRARLDALMAHRLEMVSF